MAYSIDKQRHADRSKFGKHLGQRLRQVRKDKGLTQEALAELAGYHPKYISNVEQAVYSPSAFMIWRLASAMGMSFSELVEKI